jgi:NADH-quinone oxidoreductase subunit L
MRDHPNILEEMHHVPFLVVLSPLLVGIVGIALAYLFYIRQPDLPGRLAGKVRPIYLFLLNKWYFDELYDRIFVRPAKLLGLGLWHGGDQAIIDRFGPDGIAATALAAARRTVRLQTGYVYHYAFVMLVGVAALVTWYLVVMRG